MLIYEKNTDRDSYGYCPDHLIPSSQDCGENYGKIQDICVRVSPHALDWLSAEKQCIKEGGHLLPILTEDIQSQLELLIRGKLRSKSHFTSDKFSTGLSSSMTKFWIGGAVSCLVNLKLS